MTKKAPVLFLSHGGPNIGFTTNHPAHIHLRDLGQIISALDLKAIIAISAHWQGGESHVQVNVGEHEDLIYDFYGFPNHYYLQKYPNIGDTKLANRVIDLLSDAGIKANPVHRGLDHGIWVPFKIALPQLDIPIVTVSLFDSESVEDHLGVGAALAPLRNEGIAVIGGGMSVHNMRDMHIARQYGKQGVNYGPEFHSLLRQVLEKDNRQEEMKKLMDLSVARKAHPTFEHFMPLAVCLGAADSDQAKISLDFIDPELGDAIGYMFVEFS